VRPAPYRRAERFEELRKAHDEYNLTALNMKQFYLRDQRRPESTDAAERTCRFTSPGKSVILFPSSKSLLRGLFGASAPHRLNKTMGCNSPTVPPL